MGLLNKIKGILFEEVEEDEVVSTPKSEEKKPIAEKIEPQRKVEEPVEKSVQKVTAPVKETKTENLNERDLFKSDNLTFFLIFSLPIVSITLPSESMTCDAVFVIMSIARLLQLVYDFI